MPVTRPKCARLTIAPEKPIDLAVMYTFRQIASEMCGLPLRTHTITFMTAYSDKIRPRAARWDYLFGLRRCWGGFNTAITLMNDSMVGEVYRLLADHPLVGTPWNEVRIHEIAHRSQTFSVQRQNHGKMGEITA